MLNHFHLLSVVLSLITLSNILSHTNLEVNQLALENQSASWHEKKSGVFESKQRKSKKKWQRIIITPFSDTTFLKENVKNFKQRLHVADYTEAKVVS